MAFVSMMLVTIVILIIVSLIAYIIQAVGLMAIFRKTGTPGWIAFIPILSQYKQFELFWSPTMFIATIGITMFNSGLSFAINLVKDVNNTGASIFVIFVGLLSICLSLALIVVNIVLQHRMAQAFGEGMLFTVGLVLLPIIFYPLLGFGSAEYQGHFCNYEDCNTYRGPDDHSGEVHFDDK